MWPVTGQVPADRRHGSPSWLPPLARTAHVDQNELRLLHGPPVRRGLTDNPGWKPRRSGRGGMPGPPDCRTRPRDWAGVPVPPVPDAGAGDGVARALRPGPVRLEPGAGAGQLLRHRRPQGLPELRRAVSATDRGPGGAP